MQKAVGMFLLVTLMLILAGCIGGQSQTSKPNTQNSIVMANGQIDMSKISNLEVLSKLGKGIKCTGKEKESSGSGTYSETVDYYVKGPNWKLIIHENETKVIIHKVEDGKANVYMQVPDLPGDCKWIVLPGSTSSVNMPALGLHGLSVITPSGLHLDQTWECHIEDLNDAIFQPTGKVCTTQDLIQQAMQGA